MLREMLGQKNSLNAVGWWFSESKMVIVSPLFLMMMHCDGDKWLKNSAHEPRQEQNDCFLMPCENLETIHILCIFKYARKNCQCIWPDEDFVCMYSDEWVSASVCWYKRVPPLSASMYKQRVLMTFAFLIFPLFENNVNFWTISIRAYTSE